ncbi:MAG: glycosyltransferase family 2 protein [Vicinamibacteria bacterium]
MQVSVLICTYQRHELLEKALTALIRDTTEKPDQVVVVNGGDAEADRVVASFSGQELPRVELVNTRNVNLATSRNLGLDHCTGEIIGMTDDDAMVFPDWVSALKRAHHAHPEAGAVGGAVFGSSSDTLVGRVADLVTFPSWPSARYVRSLPGVNISYKREVVRRVGYQDVSLARGEDVDFNWRVQELGYKILFDPDIKVHHYHRATLRGLLRQFYMYGRFYYLVRRKWPEMYALYPRGLRRGKDFLKLANFFAETIYGPFLTARAAGEWSVRLGAVPVLTLTGLAWRAGLLRQMMAR